MKSAGNGDVVQSRLQVLHVHVFLVAPLGARHMAEPGTDQHQSRVIFYLISNIKKLLLSENKLFFPQYGQVHVQPFVDISSKQLFHRGGFALHVVRIKSIIVSKAVGKLNIDRR